MCVGHTTYVAGSASRCTPTEQRLARCDAPRLAPHMSKVSPPTPQPPKRERDGERVLIVAPDSAALRLLLRVLADARIGYCQVVDEANGVAALGAGGFDVVVSGIEHGSPDAELWLERLGELASELAVISLADGAVKDEPAEGICGHISAALEPAAVLDTIEGALRTARFSGLRRAAHPASAVDELLTHSSAMRGVTSLIERVAPSAATVMIRGESGTGKEVIARRLHERSPRANAPLIKVHCAALPEQILESELFGYERGAFTGAHARKPGRVELAEGGTLFLDEIGEISMSVQVKLLRLLQDRQYERLGGTRTLSANVRFVTATHRNLEKMVRAVS